MRSDPYPADRGRSRNSIDVEAARCRNLLGFGPTERITGERLLRALSNLKVGKWRVSYEVTDLQPGVLGESSFDERFGEFVIRLTPETYDQVMDDDPRALFTVLHELGHLELHPNELIRLSRLPASHRDQAFQRGKADRIPAYKNVEWQANSFAASFLMPLAALDRFQLEQRLDVQTLTRELGVSFTSARYRINDYTKVSR